MTNEKLIAENIKVKIQLAEKRMSRLEAWYEVERKEDSEQYQASIYEMEQLRGYVRGLEELLQFPQLRNSK